MFRNTQSCIETNRTCIVIVESLKNSSRLAKPQVGGPSKSLHSSGRPSSQSPPSFRCFRCGGPHVVRFCPHPVSNVTCDRCHRYGHATKDYCVQFGALKSSGVQQVQQNNNKKQSS